MRILWFLLCLVAGDVWSTDWYVRPASGEYGAENGTSYATAYDGFLDIVWAADVDAGDTLYVCGTFNDNQQLLVQDNGSAGNVITIQGDCSAAGDLSQAKIIAGTDALALHNGDKVYITYKNLELVGGSGITQRVFDVTAAADTSATNINATLENITCHDTMGEGGTVRNSDFQCIRLDGSIISLTNVTVYNTEGDGIYAEGNDHTLTNITISNVDLSATPFGDCVQYGGGASSTEYAHNRVVIDGLQCDHTSKATKHGVVFGCDLGAGTSFGLVLQNSVILGAAYNIAIDECDEVIVRRNYFVPHTGSSARGFGTFTGGASEGAYIYSNVFDGQGAGSGYAAVFIDTPTSANIRVWNNTFYMAGTETTSSGIYFSTPTTTTYDIRNNTLSNFTARAIRVDAGGSGTASYNHFDGNATNCQTLSCSNSVTGAPNFVAPTIGRAAGLKPNCANTAIDRVGTFIQPLQDYGNRAFANPPTIGAWECASGDARPTVTARP